MDYYVFLILHRIPFYYNGHKAFFLKLGDTVENILIDKIGQVSLFVRPQEYQEWQESYKKKQQETEDSEFKYISEVDEFFRAGRKKILDEVYEFPEKSLDMIHVSTLKNHNFRIWDILRHSGEHCRIRDSCQLYF